jgi:hypothetical protein
MLNSQNSITCWSSQCLEKTLSARLRTGWKEIVDINKIQSDALIHCLQQGSWTLAQENQCQPVHYTERSVCGERRPCRTMP